MYKLVDTIGPSVYSNRKQQGPIMRVIGYIRTSTDKQEDSVDTQKFLIDNYSLKVKSEQCLFFIDEAISGTTTLENRPSLMKLLNDLKKNDHVVVQRKDRLARDLFLCLIIEKEIKKKGARLISLAGEGTEMEGAQGEFIQNIFAIFSELERNIIKERTKIALKTKKDRKERMGYIPYGQKLADDRLHLEPHQEEQLIIREILELSKTLNFTEIERKLKKKGRVNRYGRPWDDKAISRIVKKFK